MQVSSTYGGEPRSEKLLRDESTLPLSMSPEKTFGRPVSARHASLAHKENRYSSADGS